MIWPMDSGWFGWTSGGAWWWNCLICASAFTHGLQLHFWSADAKQFPKCTPNRKQADDYRRIFACHMVTIRLHETLHQSSAYIYWCHPSAGALRYLSGCWCGGERCRWCQDDFWFQFMFSVPSMFFFFKFLNPGYCISSQSGVFPTVTPIAAGRISPILQEVTTCLAQV